MAKDGISAPKMLIVSSVLVGQRYQSPVPLESASRMIPRDAAQPCGYRRPAGLVPRRLAHHCQEHILGHVFGRRAPAGHQQRDAVDVSLPSPKKRRECHPVPCSDALEQGIVERGVGPRIGVHTMRDSTPTSSIQSGRDRSSRKRTRDAGSGVRDPGSGVRPLTVPCDPLCLGCPWPRPSPSYSIWAHRCRRARGRYRASPD